MQRDRYDLHPFDGDRMKLAGVTLNQFVKTGLIAVVFIVLFKLLADKSKIAGLQAVAKAV